MPLLRRARSGVALAVAACTILLAGCFSPTVSPSVTPSRFDFEGLRVAAYVPESPAGIVYVFHGRFNSVDFGNEVETVDVLNELVGRGYGYVVSESVERSGNMRWDSHTGSRSDNPDLARMERLHQSIVNDTAVDSSTALYALGHSNGSRFATLFAQTMVDAGYRVGAVGAYNGETADPVFGNYRVPTFFVGAFHDPLTDYNQVVVSHLNQLNLPMWTDLRVAEEQNLSPARFTRIPGVDGNLSQEIYNFLVVQGIWHPEGYRIIDHGDAFARLDSAALPPAAEGFRAEIVRQAQVVLGGHAFRADFKVDMVSFFDAFR